VIPVPRKKKEIDQKGAETILLDFLDTLQLPEREETIKDLLHRLNFELRFTQLTPEELAHMLDEGLSPQERAALDREKPGSQAFEDRLQMYARAKYFRRMDWASYLNGETNKKPFTSNPVAPPPGN